jgi:hypothetical protein
MDCKTIKQSAFNYKLTGFGFNHLNVQIQKNNRFENLSEF